MAQNGIHSHFESKSHAEIVAIIAQLVAKEASKKFNNFFQ